MLNKIRKAKLKITLTIISLLSVFACAGGATIGQLLTIYRVSRGTVSGQIKPTGLSLVARNKNGTVVWNNTIPGVTNYDAKVFDGILLLSVESSGALSSSSTWIVDSGLSRPIKIDGNLSQFRSVDHVFLFVANLTHAPTDDEGINFIRVSTQPKLQVKELHFEIPKRPNCGLATGIMEAGAQSISNHYIYEIRSDECGQFVSRFDWVNPENPVLIYQR